MQEKHFKNALKCDFFAISGNIKFVIVQFLVKKIGTKIALDIDVSYKI